MITYPHLIQHWLGWSLDKSPTNDYETIFARMKWRCYNDLPFSFIYHGTAFDVLTGMPFTSCNVEQYLYTLSLDFYNPSVWDIRDHGAIVSTKVSIEFKKKSVPACSSTTNKKYASWHFQNTRSMKTTPWINIYDDNPLYTTGKGYAIFGKYNGNTSIWHFDLLEMAPHKTPNNYCEFNSRM